MEEQKIEKILEYWFKAALLGLAFPVILAILVHFNPSIFETVGGSPRMFRLEVPKLPGPTVAFLTVAWSTLLYWGFGLYSARRFFILKEGWRSAAARVLLIFSWGGFFLLFHSFLRPGAWPLL